MSFYPAVAMQRGTRLEPILEEPETHTRGQRGPVVLDARRKVRKRLRELLGGSAPESKIDAFMNAFDEYAARSHIQRHHSVHLASLELRLHKLEAKIQTNQSLRASLMSLIRAMRAKITSFGDKVSTVVLSDFGLIDIETRFD
ncbi:hypothetical protein CDD82_3540 [Ophiocordyceps australis]|uniref:Uncharacterized protein n=1 Tax=Ophiocordyceps australis TaxID=1399860 RepID=A0A2C5ZCC5_9HYPO|nr:hypothetical protein CDD82_3540 [Ophiocordyceps australis]